MPAAAPWLLALWPLQVCWGLQPAAAAGTLRARGPEAPPPPAGPTDADAPRPSAFDQSIDGVGWAPREARPAEALRRRREGRAQPPAAPPRVERLRRLRWLHIPKTGTSLIATIWNYACGQRGAPLDLHVDAYHGPFCGQCYDFAVMDRYPRERYCEPGVLSSHFDTQHPAAKQWEFSSESVVGFFRRPSQRILSAHRNGLHASGLGAEGFRALVASCGHGNASCFARWRGIAGCSAKMLSGHDCADPEPSRPWDGGLRHVSTAVANVERMRFVGLTEAWDESVCLFHRMFGGRISPAEFQNFHSSHPGKSEDYDEAELHGFVDEADERVYAAAERRFAALRVEYAGGGSACTDDLEISHAHAQGSEEDLSCAASGCECGLLPGGQNDSEAQLDCGRCPPKRAEGAAAAGAAPGCLAGGRCDLTGLAVPPGTFSWHHAR